jgi:excisionase family DNA binding protein
MSTSTTTTKRLLTVEETAAYLGISKLTVYDWVSQRKIEYVKIGRLVEFDLRILDKWIDQNTVKARQQHQHAA